MQYQPRTAVGPDGLYGWVLKKCAEAVIPLSQEMGVICHGQKHLLAKRRPRNANLYPHELKRPKLDQRHMTPYGLLLWFNSCTEAEKEGLYKVVKAEGKITWISLPETPPPRVTSAHVNPQGPATSSTPFPPVTVLWENTG